MVCLAALLGCTGTDPAGETEPSPEAVEVEPRIREMGAQLVEHREAAKAHLEGKTPNLVDRGWLMVDATALGPARTVDYLLVPGALSEAQLATGRSMMEAARKVEGYQHSMLGGADKDRPKIFTDVPDGDYTVCVDLAPVDAPASERFEPDERPLCQVVTAGKSSESRVVAFR